jgi:carboxyvinyl-carboxyphosphonate phosphorylmutase
MNLSPRRQQLRAILEGDTCIFPGSVFDPISARLAQDLDFQAGMFAGSIASLTVLGAPDIIVLTLSEFAAQAQRICRAAEIPLIVDADHGYGNAMNVKRTVEELESAGVSCLTIEDTLLPTPFASSKTEFLSIDESVGKMKAALAGRQDPELIILGRTGSIGPNGIEDAIARASAYVDAGVDGVMFVGVKTREQIDLIAQAIKVPVMLGGTPEELQDIEYLSSRGVRICLQGHQPLMAAVQAIHDTLKALKAGVAPSKLDGIANAELIKQVSRDADYKAWQDEFLN